MIAFVLLVLSALVFLLKLLKVDIGDLDMTTLGLLLMAAGFCAWLYWGSWRTRQVP